MDNYWYNYIQTEICRPLEIALRGENPRVNSPFSLSYHLIDLLQYVKGTEERRELLYQCLLPYLKEYLFDPERRMCDDFVQNETDPLFWRHAATSFIASYLSGYAWIKPLFDGKDLCKVIEKWADQCAMGFDRTHDHLEWLTSAVKNGYETDWEELSARVALELKHSPSDYDKHRMEYYCFLDGIIKIALDQETDSAQKCELWTLLHKQWSVIAAIYSVLTGKILRFGYKHFTQVICHFRDVEKEYALLMVAAIRHHPLVLQTQRARQIYGELELAAKQIKQKQDLNKLCRCIFPSENWNSYDLSTPKMTAAEMAAKIDFLEKELAQNDSRKQDQRKLEAYAEYLKQQLGKSISMEELTAAILNCPAQIANVIFTQLDLRLEDVNPVWTSHRKELKHKVLALEQVEKNLLNETCNKVTAIEQAPRTVHIAHNTAPISIGQQYNYEGLAPTTTYNQLNNKELPCHL